MRNPLLKRLPRELRNEFGKYVVIFLFFIMVIGFVSGFLVASESMQIEYDSTFEKYNMEHGNFEITQAAEEDLKITLRDEGVTIYENYYIEKETKDFESTLRVFKNRENVNLVCLLDGEWPTKKNEIAIDRVYAQNNNVSIGDKIRFSNAEWIVTGYVALPDYSTMLASPSDMMFDANMFGVGIVTEEMFDDFLEESLHYSYSWKYDKAPIEDTEKKEKSEDLLEIISGKAMLVQFIPEYSNQAIHFAGDDMGKDYMMFMVFLYIVVIIIAFIFAITTSNTITKESTVIGTLRASGYSKGELISHYMTLSVGVTFLAAVVGNVLGYTYFRNIAEGLYQNSYSLTSYKILWNEKAFIYTTVIPVFMMILINYVILVNKFKANPLAFMRRNLSKNKRRKAIRLNKKIGIMKRFRIRILLQNLPNYITIVVGVFFANIIILLGIAMPSLMQKYQQDITDNRISDYQYILKMPIETENETAETICFGSLSYVSDKGRKETVSLFGVELDSQYIDIPLEGEGVYISDSLSEKYGVKVGEKLKLQEFGGETYDFKVDGVYHYPSGLAIFMSQNTYIETFDLEEDYYNGYFTNEEITDIEEQYIETIITINDMTKMSRQLMDSIGSVMDIMFLFGLIMFMLIIYLLSKIIIEKNAQSIAMTKILGYSNREISALYIMSTAIVVIVSLILTLPLVDCLLEIACRIMMDSFAGWLPYYVPFYAYGMVVGAGILAYGVIAFLQFRKVKKVPLDMVLKNVE